jgi:hypothetical protein
MSASENTLSGENIIELIKLYEKDFGDMNNWSQENPRNLKSQQK